METTNNMTREKWSQLSVKEKITYSTAVASFVAGWILIAAGFIVPPMGEISGSVLSAFGMALAYVGSILGVSLHYSSELQKFKTEVRGRLVETK